MLTTSALYHRVHWSDIARRRMRHADHSMIFVCIAGTYTAVAGLTLPDTDAWIVLGLVWTASLVGIVMRFVWLDAPKWAVALPYVAAGWIAVGAMPEFFHYLGVAGFSLMMAGGLLYTVGAVVYARRRPDPWPRVFGYHEVFHSCVVVHGLAPESDRLHCAAGTKALISRLVPGHALLPSIALGWNVATASSWPNLVSTATTGGRRSSPVPCVTPASR